MHAATRLYGAQRSAVRPFFLQDQIETPNIPESAKIQVSPELTDLLLERNAAQQVLEPRIGAERSRADPPMGFIPGLTAGATVPRASGPQQ
jgi:hypothetical protein